MHDNRPYYGMHKAALDYGEFLNQMTPRPLLIVEQNLPALIGAGAPHSQVILRSG